MRQTLTKKGENIMVDSTRTIQARVESNTRRVDNRLRDAQARLADKSFSAFVKAHNATQKGL